ncbi:NAD-dependent deacetylase [Albidovulum inexpectatum]|uniref:NAD-dependent protein deacylase n=1 Tax=Albidovulum inexpectatum TaxID=196587 RepID=A0A2S5JKY4_9RHOB|nr:NAD-dependent deacylase [Albidovulum inexpectatum]PPB82217.1 NAD-dependent deacetylase [Albidovulum inexpectatum]
MSKPAHVFILTGAGISAESGLQTFRDKGGLWAKYDWRALATPDAFARDPAHVLEFYDLRRQAVRQAQPNPAHEAIARLQQRFRGRVTLVTQNVDDLHERADSPEVIHMHGSHLTARCCACDHRWPAPSQLRVSDPCPACGARPCRPDVVWFGEIPHHLDQIAEALADCDLFVAIGTSGTVQPAASLAHAARAAGAHTLALNLQRTENSNLFDETRLGPASRIVPEWVERMLAC